MIMHMPSVSILLPASYFQLFSFLTFYSRFQALLWYWSLSNTISIGQALILRTKPVREYLKFPERIPPPPQETSKRGFVQGFKECKTLLLPKLFK